MKERLHIAQFTNTYYPVVSGVVRSISTFRRALVERGHNVFIFAQNVSDWKDEEPFVFRYPAIELPVANDFPITFPISPLIDRVVPILKPDVIHSHHPFLIGQAAARKAEELDLPLVFTHHTRYREYTRYLALPQELLRKAVERWVGDYLHHCQHIIAPSESIKQMLQESYGIADGITVVPTGIDLAPYVEANGAAIRRRHSWTNDQIIVSVGRLQPEKNWDTLLLAAAEVMSEHPRVRLVLIGDGDERKHLKKLARELGISRRVNFMGMIPFAQVPAYLKAADLFSFASESETQGLVTMEAMAASLPVVAVAATGTSDVVEHGIDGLLTSADSHELAAAIVRVLGDAALAESLRQAAGKKAESFSIDNQVERLLGVYRQAMIDKKRGRRVEVDEHKPIFKVDWQERFRIR